METLLRGGNAERGRLVFEQRAGCASCHQTSGRGGILGPDLTKIGAIRAGRDLVESVVIPSATFAQGYETYTARLSDGEAVTGIRVQQSDDAFVLRGASGSETRIPGGVEIGREKISLMPDGLLSALTDVEIRDLFAYLQSLK
jgi:putative heme-binding domain-containing protein